MTRFGAVFMYIRTKSSPRSKNISVQLVESQRVNGKIKQNVIRHLGTAPVGEELEKLKQLAKGILFDMQQESLLKIKKSHSSESSRFGMLSPINEEVFLKGISLEESKRVILGIHDIYGYIYNHIGFNKSFSSAQKRKASGDILREIVMARIAHPQSKRASTDYLASQFGIELNLDHVYQMMDKIDDAFCERIQQQALTATLELTGEKLRVLFYDATTLYFESFSEDDLKKNGYSKDMKFNQPQVLLALFVTESGLPVGYELFPGNTFEGHTVTIALNKLKERYHIHDVIFVADRGMLSDTNLRFLEENHYHYIVGAKLRSLDEAGQAAVLQWLNSISKDQVTDEMTQRITVTPQAACSIKIFSDFLSEADCNKIKKETYVLWRENKEWQFAIYENGKIKKTLSILDINELHVLLSQAPKNEKKLPAETRKKILSFIKSYHNKPKLLVLSYRKARALKDQADRERAIQKLQMRLKRSRNPKQLISQYGFQKFVEVDGEAELKIDDKKLIEESQWDGVAGMYISHAAFNDEEVIKHYRGLWQVEESFRIQKHDLKIRPIYHWTPQRIKAHIAIAFMAFVCVRYLEYRVATQSQKLSPKVLKDTLVQYQASFITDDSTQKTYLLPSKCTSHVKEIYRVMGIKMQKGLKEVQCSA